MQAQNSFIRPSIFDALGQVFAAFTMRPFSGPSREQAEAAARGLARQHGFHDLALTEQVHGADVAVVDEGGTLPNHDGLVTARRGLLLGTVAADCALVLLADAEAGVVGACHAGWRGAVQQIPIVTIQRMASLGADPRRTRAYVGPCISVSAFEVGEEVAGRFDDRYVQRRAEWPRPHVDLRTAVADQLLDSGVPREHVEISDQCTFSDEARFHSYRRDAEAAGRMLGLIGLRPRTPE